MPNIAGRTIVTKIDAAAIAIKTAGWDRLAREFKDHPEYRERIIRFVVARTSRDLGAPIAQRLETALYKAIQ